MNKIKERFNNLTEYGKVGLVFGICSLLLLIVGLIGVTTANTETGYLSKQTVNGLVFDNGKMDVNSGLTRHTVEVRNDTNDTYSLKTISVVFTDISGNKEELIGYIGNTIKSGETKLLDVAIDKEITDIKNIEYRINK